MAEKPAACITTEMTPLIQPSLLRYYQALENRYPVMMGTRYADLVVPNGNEQAPFHRWFHLKEGFSYRLLARVLEDTGLSQTPRLRVLDSFAGVGTAPVSALQAPIGRSRSVEAYGIEQNPFLHLVGQTKMRALAGEESDFPDFVKEVVSLVQANSVQAGPVPRLSTFSNAAYFEPGALATLLKLRSAIDSAEGLPLSRELARISLAATVEPVSGLRRDGRALRFVRGKVTAAPAEEFLTKCKLIAEDLSCVGASAGSKGRIYLGDGRRPQTVLPQGFKADLVLFSPPYPNNIDYTEVYKLETWLLQFITSREEFRSQRLRTLRSHPSVRFPEVYGASRNNHAAEFDAILAPLMASVPNTRERSWRLRLIRGYFDDMLETLQNHAQLLADGGALVYVVGNSLHGSGNQRFLVAADLLMARLAELAGLAVESFVVARRPARKSVGGPLLRESVVFLRKV